MGFIVTIKDNDIITIIITIITRSNHHYNHQVKSCQIITIITIQSLLPAFSPQATQPWFQRLRLRWPLLTAALPLWLCPKAATEATEWWDEPWEKHGKSLGKWRETIGTWRFHQQKWRISRFHQLIYDGEGLTPITVGERLGLKPKPPTNWGRGTCFQHVFVHPFLDRFLYMYFLSYPQVNQHNYGQSQFLMGKSTISMAIFNSKLLVYQRVPSSKRTLCNWKSPICGCLACGHLPPPWAGLDLHHRR